MRLKKARRILKSFADDTRLRIINLLYRETLNVTELCRVIGASQSSVSKHLSRLRLTGIVNDKRKGFNVYYRLIKPEDRVERNLIKGILAGLSELEAVKKDTQRLRLIKRSAGSKRPVKR